jgi:DNA topoisomerase-6 subunit A
VEKDVIKFRRCQAKFVLFVEKGAVWSRLNEDKFWKKHKCLLLTSEGMPPRGVRRLVHRIDKELKLPVYVLVDNDPWGFYIYSVVKQGSINLAYESIRMAIPKAKFLGLGSDDAGKYKLSKNVTIRLNEKDKQRAKQLLEYPWFKKRAWQKEIRTMLKNDVKLELEALSSKGISFISEEYLPKKIRGKDWLD